MKKKTLVLVCVFAAFINAVFCQNTQTNEKGIAQSDEEIMKRLEGVEPSTPFCRNAHKEKLVVCNYRYNTDTVRYSVLNYPSLLQKSSVDRVIKECIAEIAGATVAMRVILSDNCGNTVTKEQSVVMPNVYKYIHIDTQGVSSTADPTNQTIDFNDIIPDRVYYNGAYQVTNIIDRLRFNCGAGISPYASVDCSLGAISLRNSYDQWEPIISSVFPSAKLFVFDGQAPDNRCFSVLLMRLELNGCDVLYEDLHVWQQFCAGWYYNGIDVNAADYFYFIRSYILQYNTFDPIVDLGW